MVRFKLVSLPKGLSLLSTSRTKKTSVKGKTKRNKEDLEDVGSFNALKGGGPYIDDFMVKVPKNQ